MRVDVGQMEQVVMNLVVNARDAMPRGGTLTIGTMDVELVTPLAASHGSVPPGSYSVLSVEDTGEGIDPANMARIFEPFFTTKAAGQGTGLGLSTVYGIVTQSGGYMDVRSEVGCGTKFRIYVPRLGTGCTAEAAAAEAGEYAQGDETILLTEDQEALREVLQETLQDLGYRVLAADGADSALAVAAAHRGPIHLLLTDVVMPRASGPQLAAQLAAVRPQTRVLFMSGYTDDMLGRQGTDALGHSLIEKPFTSAALARRVRDVLAPSVDGSGQAEDAALSA